MPLIILGLFFGLGIIVYYIITSMLSDMLSDEKRQVRDYRFDGNVISLTGDWEKEKQKWLDKSKNGDKRKNG